MVTRKTAQELETGDLLENQYRVTWISQLELRDGTCIFDVVDTRDGGIHKKVSCPPGTTFSVKKEK